MNLCKNDIMFSKKENQPMNDNQVNEQSENIWYPIYEENSNMMMAQKTSNGVTIKVPATTEILKTIKKQMEVNTEFKKIFQKVSIDNEHIIAYLYLALDQHINFLEQDNLSYLINMMKQLEQSTHIDPNNIAYINQLRTSYQTKDIENFNDILEQFKDYNKDYFSQFYNKENTVKSH